MGALTDQLALVMLQAFRFPFHQHHHCSPPSGDVQWLVRGVENENLAHASPLNNRPCYRESQGHHCDLHYPARMRDQIADDRNAPWIHKPGEANPRQRAWLEVSDSAIEANARSLKRHLGPTCDLMAVVKADGYGHGAETVAKASVRGGATSFGVATLQEGIDLRNAGLDQPVLVLGHLSQPDDLRACLQWRLMPTLSSMREALLCQNLADSSGRRFPVQLKVDTGMTRLGCDWKDGKRLAHAIQQLDQLNLSGIYSHLALADGDETDMQPK